MTVEKLMQDLGLLALRLVGGGMMLFGHGLGKLMNFSSMKDSFPDPIGVGSTISAALAVGAEFFCAALLILGVKTRLVAIPLAITMGVAGFIFHASDPWQQKELAFVYLGIFIAIALLGAGDFSADTKFKLCKKG